MERFVFDATVAVTPPDALLQGVTVAPLTRPLPDHAAFQVALFRIAASGRIARHPASVPQILAVIAGSGKVSGSDGISEDIPREKQCSGPRVRSMRRAPTQV